MSRTFLVHPWRFEIVHFFLTLKTLADLPEIFVGPQRPFTSHIFLSGLQSDLLTIKLSFGVPYVDEHRRGGDEILSQPIW